MLLYFSNSFTLSNHCLLDLISEKRLYLAQIWCKGSIAPFVRCLVVDEDSIGYLLSVGDLHVAWHVKAPCHLSANPFSGTIWGRKQRWKWLTQVLPFWASAEPQARTISASDVFISCVLDCASVGREETERAAEGLSRPDVLPRWCPSDSDWKHSRRSGIWLETNTGEIVSAA